MPKDDRIVRDAERRLITGIGRSTALLLEKQGAFPHRVVLAGNRCGWRLSELRDWVASRQPKPEATKAA